MVQLACPVALFIDNGTVMRGPSNVPYTECNHACTWIGTKKAKSNNPVLKKRRAMLHVVKCFRIKYMTCWVSIISILKIIVNNLI